MKSQLLLDRVQRKELKIIKELGKCSSAESMRHLAFLICKGRWNGKQKHVKRIGQEEAPLVLFMCSFSFWSIGPSAMIGFASGEGCEGVRRGFGKYARAPNIRPLCAMLWSLQQHHPFAFVVTSLPNPTPGTRVNMLGGKQEGIKPTNACLCFLWA